MDPASALFFALLLTVVGAKTIGAAVTDTVAVAKGKEPPSKQRFEDRQRRRQAKGQKRQADPGPWRRRWHNAMAEQREKIDAKHEGAMAWLRDHHDDLVSKEYRKRERRARRWEQVGAAAGGFVTAKGLRGRLTAAAQATRHGRDVPLNPHSGLADLGSVDELRQAYGEADNDLRREAVREELHRRGYIALAATIGAPPALQDRITKDALAAQQAGHAATLADLDAFTKRRALTEQFELAAQQQAKADAEAQAKVLPFRRSEEDTTDTDQTAIPEQVEPHELDQPTETATQEVATVSAPTQTEITDLPSAKAFSEENATYAEQVSAELSDIVAALQTFTQGMSTEAGVCDAASSVLAGEGFGSTITGAFDSSTESLNSAAEQIKAALDKVTEAQEAVDTVAASMRSAAQLFGSQEHIADTLGAHAQSEGVAKNTSFYVNA